MAKSLRYELLEKIFSQPTAPFREKHVITAVLEELRAERVPHFQDPIGNIIIGVASQKEYLRLVRTRSSEPVRVFMAHMDHPGFIGTEWKSRNELAVKWHGGSPAQHLDGAKVWLADRLGWAGEGELTQVKMLGSGPSAEAMKQLTSARGLESGVIQIAEGSRLLSGLSQPTVGGIFGGFKFRAPVWREADVIYTKAADDLGGVFSIVTLAIELFGGKRKSTRRIPFLGLLTRAEEVGFIGAIGHFQLGWLQKAKRQIVCVSLETSRTLPGAEIGKGPVVRLGDRTTVFSPELLHVLTAVAKSALPDRHQKRIMDGGTCEATASLVFGIPAIGISVPLGNYHNQSFEGGPDSRGPMGPAPEFIHLDDLSGMIELCRALMVPKLAWVAPWHEKLKGFNNDLKKYRQLLRSGP